MKAQPLPVEPEPLEVQLMWMPHGAHLEPPHYASAGAAGMDLKAAITEPMVLAAGARAMVPTGLAVAVPHGYEAQVRPRSGLAASHGLTVLNSPGTIDSDYRGEVKVILINLGDAPFTVEPGMRIAQMVFSAHARVDWKICQRLTETIRGSEGFGSTGTTC